MNASCLGPWGYAKFPAAASNLDFGCLALQPKRVVGEEVLEVVRGEARREGQGVRRRAMCVAATIQ